mmetsp:Transcript_4628/g.11894  ORF Transcript_4628/g.11894 Transcript_4628/m.11894 type:complete len:201 (-) Transcript_4628:1813-2415(-)
MWLKILWTSGMLRQMRASSMDPGYFSAANQTERRPAAPKTAALSKPSAPTQPSSVDLSSGRLRESRRFARKPTILALCGRPPGGTLKRTHSSAPVFHSMPRNMMSQSGPSCARRWMRPGSSPRRRSSCSSSRSQRKRHVAAMPPSATAARIASTPPFAETHGTWHSYAQVIPASSRRASPAPGAKRAIWSAPRYFVSCGK